MPAARKHYKYEIVFMSARSSTKGDEVEKREKYQLLKTAEARYRNLERLGIKPCLHFL